jgi:AraC-like DNA-binding protein
LQRTRSDLARASQGGMHLAVLFRGQNHFFHRGRRHLMPEGSFTFASNEAPVSGTFVNHHSLCITLPMHWDRIGKLRLEDILGRGFAMQNGRSSRLTTYLQRLMTQPDNVSSARFEDEFFDVLALELNPRAASDHGGGLLTLMRQYIDLHFRDPGLSPTEVAATFNISLSYLHRLFAGMDTTFGSYVTALRLAYAKDLLCDPRHAKRRILELAFDSGFSDINHFGRRFKESFGCTPGEMRAVSSMGQALLLDIA